VTTAFHDQLGTYFASRRWFAGKGRDFEITHVHRLPWLRGGDPLVRIEVVTVAYADGKHDAYQFPVAYLDEPDPAMSHAFVGMLDDRELGRVAAYDAVYFKAATDVLLEGFHAKEATNELAFHVVDGAELPAPGVSGTVMTGEQSNTSIAYGDEGILKLFRRISAGGNPDIEIHEALTRHGAEHVAPLLGWISGRWNDPDDVVHEGHFGMLQVLLRTATDGWTIALSSVRDLLVEGDLHPEDVGGDFAGESERLGEATAQVHADLAAVFGSTYVEGDALTQLAAAMHWRLDAAIVVVPELAELASRLRPRFDALAQLSSPMPVQRVHGDLHLGQTLRTVKGWKIIDFEGEPAKSLEERVALDTPLRDVAGMLRSFDYAAGASLHEFGFGPQLEYRADEWSRRNRDAFLAGYAATSGLDLEEAAAVLRAYETDKAVYEAVYEARNRPTWLPIPLHAARRQALEE
jgi:maltokinase